MIKFKYTIEEITLFESIIADICDNNEILSTVRVSLNDVIAMSLEESYSCKEIREFIKMVDNVKACNNLRYEDKVALRDITLMAEDIREDKNE